MPKSLAILANLSFLEPRGINKMSVIDTLNECDSHPQISVWMFAECLCARPSFHFPFVF